MARYTIKKPEKHILILLISLCVFLIVLILYIQGKTVGLQKLLTKKTESKDAKVEKQVEVVQPYTCDLRILLKDTDGDIYRDSICFSSEKGMTVETEASVTSLSAGEIYDHVDSKKVRLIPLEDGQIFDVNGDGTESKGYEGAIELNTLDQGVVVVNEIRLENYLKRVVPSEMPHTYGIEALKAQAVCARTYAYAHSNAYAYPEVQAHMDDTVSFQVYNNCDETPETNQAIAETTGQILKDGDQVLDTMYYSTSCGYTQDGSVFGDKLSKDVFRSVYVGMEDKKEDFDSYIRKADDSAYESKERYFRWKAQVSDENLNLLRDKICQLQKEEGVISCEKKMRKRLAENSNGKSAFGNLNDIRIEKRNAGGVAMSMTLIFSKGEISVNGQLQIREVLGSITDRLTLQDGEVLSDVQALPSAAFSVEKQSGGSWILYGGGFGHGVGMSQNGAKSLAVVGYTYADILKFFYKDTTLANIEENVQ